MKGNGICPICKGVNDKKLMVAVRIPYKEDYNKASANWYYFCNEICLKSWLAKVNTSIFEAV